MYTSQKINLCDDRLFSTDFIELLVSMYVKKYKQDCILHKEFLYLLEEKLNRNEI